MDKNLVARRGFLFLANETNNPFNFIVTPVDRGVRRRLDVVEH